MIRRINSNSSHGNDYISRHTIIVTSDDAAVTESSSISADHIRCATLAVAATA